jgi:cardiolipin synthase
MSEWLMLPNLLTLARMGLTPWAGVAIASRNYETALPVLFVAGITDGLDGYIARRYQMQSRLGAKLDPIADKLLAATVFLALAINGGVPLWMAGLVLGRDLMILSFAAWALWRGVKAELAPTLWGKLSTLLQLMLAVAVVLREALELRGADPPLSALLWASAAMTVWSGLHYAWVGRRLAAEARRSTD